MELGHFDKYFATKKSKKEKGVAQANILEVFLLGTLKTTI